MNVIQTMMVECQRWVFHSIFRAFLRSILHEVMVIPCEIIEYLSVFFK